MFFCNKLSSVFFPARIESFNLKKRDRLIMF